MGAGLHPGGTPWEDEGSGQGAAPTLPANTLTASKPAAAGRGGEHSPRSLQEEPTLRTPGSQASSLQGCDTVNVCCGSRPVGGSLLAQRSANRYLDPEYTRAARSPPSDGVAREPAAVLAGCTGRLPPARFGWPTSDAKEGSRGRWSLKPPHSVCEGPSPSRPKSPGTDGALASAAVGPGREAEQSLRSVRERGRRTGPGARLCAAPAPGGRTASLLRPRALHT